MARYVTVSTVSHRGGGYGWPARPYTDVAGRLADAERYAVRARRMGADVVAFPEMYPIVDAPRDLLPQLAEPVDGPSFTHMAGVARREGMYLLWPTFRRDEQGIYNSAVLFDRLGQVAGIYDKMYPTMWEIDWGIIPGERPLVVETDFGRVGVAICYDINFPRVFEATVRAGAELILYPSASRGGLLLRSRAFQFGVYVASAVLQDEGRILNQCGDVLAQSTYEAVIAVRVNLDSRAYPTDLNQGKWDQMLGKYGTGISLTWHTREGRFTVASERADLTVDDLESEYALERVDHYLARAVVYRDRALERHRQDHRTGGTRE